MAFVGGGNSVLGNSLQQLLMADDIVPGDPPSYQTCKTIYVSHPLGAKIAEKPLTMAQSQKREISVPKGPEERVVEAFEEEWEELEADKHLFNLHRLARIYGIASVALLVEGVPSDKPVNVLKLARERIALNVFDPLNTAGSLVINQNPNSLDFLKTDNAVRVSGSTYHGSRCCVVMNEDPIYIDYTVSAFGFVGRSVYQRALFPLKSFLQSMLTDDLVTVKAGVLIYKAKQPGSIIDNVMSKLFGVKRTIVNEARTYNTLSIGVEEAVETLNMQNLDGAFGMARKDILENIAAASDDMPAKLLTSETFAEGFGEGTEDAKIVARYVDRIRQRMNPSYKFMDKLVQHRAWNPAFYETIQKEFPEEYGRVPYETAFYEWSNSFRAEWQSFLTEPPSEKARVDEIKLKAVIATIQVVVPLIDPENKARLIQWAQDNLNENKMMFTTPLDLDYEALQSYTPPEPAAGAEGEPKPGHPFAAQDSVEKTLHQLTALVDEMRRPPAKRPELVRAR